MSKKKNKDFFDMDKLELNPFSIMGKEKPNTNNTLIDLTLFEKNTFMPLMKVKKKNTKKALEQLNEVLSNKG